MAAKSAEKETPAISEIVPAREADSPIGRTLAALEAQDARGSEHMAEDTC